MTDPELDLQSEDGHDVNWWAGQALKLAFLVAACLCGILGMTRRKKR